MDLKYEDQQTIYKESMGYYNLHAKILTDKGFKIITDTKKYTVFALLEQDKKTAFDLNEKRI